MKTNQTKPIRTSMFSVGCWILDVAEADGDGYPDAGAQPVVTIPDITDAAKRVPWK